MRPDERRQRAEWLNAPLITPEARSVLLQLASGSLFLPYLSVVLTTMERDGKTVAAAIRDLSHADAIGMATAVDLTRRYITRLAELASFLVAGATQLDIALTGRDDHARIIAAVEAKAADPSGAKEK